MINKPLPSNIEAERCALGAVLLDPKAYFTAKGIISHHDFYQQIHRTIFKALEELYVNSQDVDVIKLGDYLKQQGKLEEVGGQEYLLALFDSIPTTANIKTHADVIKEKATLRRLASLGQRICLEASADNQDPGKIVETANREFFDLSLHGGGYDAAKDVIGPKEGANRAFDRVIAAKEKPQHINSIAVGFNNFDYNTKGLQNLTILSASTGMGKTGLALNWGKKIGIKDKIPCLYINYEMAQEALVNRLLAMLSGVSIDQITSGHYQPQENYDKVEEAIEAYYASKLFITDNGPKDINTTIALIYQHKIQHGIKVVFIDYLGEIEYDSLAHKEKSEYITYGRWVQMLKGVCAKLDIKLVVLAQLNRQGETSPGRANMGGSWKLVQKADVVLILYVTKKTKINPAKHILKIDKQRHGIYPVSLELSYNKLTQRVEEVGSWKDKKEPAGDTPF